ncbi:MAG: hypothetical protein MJE63_24075 [Proteobacteria bacterium]|nr:hypothetical protein [Pseudomonadota bacterium]
MFKVSPILLIIIPVLFGCTSNSVYEKKTNNQDIEYNSRIIGDWKVEIEENYTKIFAIDTYSKDGKLHSRGVVITPKNTIYVEMFGKWEIKEGFLITTLQKTTHPEILPVGYILKEKIISIDDNTFKYLTKKGEQSSVTRIKPQS